MSENLLPSLSSPYELPPSAIEEFADNGHVRLNGLLSPEEAAAYRVVIDEVAPMTRFEQRPLEERDTFGRAFVQCGLLRFVDLRADALFSSARMAQVAAELMGVDAVRGYHDQAILKEPGGGITPWHQGQFYWPFDSPDTIFMWLPLSDTSADMGVLQLANGSHRFGSLGDFHMSDESHAAFGRMIEDMSLTVPAPESYRAGDAIFARGWTFASETANDTETMREVVTMSYYADGIRIARLDHPARLIACQTFFPGCSAGDFAASARTPVLWRRPVG